MTHRISVGALYRVGIILTALCVASYLCVGSCEKIDYSAGKDTVAHFGNGRFQVLQFTKAQGLHDGQTQETLVYALHDWNRSGDWVHAVGEDTHDVLVYVVLNYRTAFHETFKSIDDAPEEYKKALAKLRPGRKLPGYD